jgi:hypothetical protein
MQVFGVRKRFYIPPLVALCLGFVIAGISPAVELDRVYGVCPVFVWYVDEESYGGDQFMGTCKGPIVIINSRHRERPEVRAHELVHAEQSYRSVFFHWIPCILSGDHLAAAEAEAYARTGMVCESDAPFYAQMIQNEYSPDTPVDFIEQKLLHHWRSRER